MFGDQQPAEPRAAIVSTMLVTAPGQKRNAPKRKLAIAILCQDALPVAAELWQSGSCEDRRPGLQILKDMDLVVAL